MKKKSIDKHLAYLVSNTGHSAGDGIDSKRGGI